MNRLLSFLFFCYLSVFITSCEKDQGDSLVGKWKFVEVYDGSAMFGNSRWVAVEEENSHTIDFSGDERFFRKENRGGNFQECTGSYQLLTNNKLEINSSCHVGPYQVTLSELNSNTMIINMQGFEGIIRHKYLLLK